MFITHLRHYLFKTFQSQTIQTLQITRYSL